MIGLIVTSPAALAEHEVDHRYVVSGYVLNQDESPISSATITINAEGVSAQDRTDSDGHFSLRLHLHDSDLGKVLQIKSDHGEGTIRVDFDPGNLTSERVHHVNFIGGQMVEKKREKEGLIPGWLYYLFAFILLIIVVPSLVKSIKRLRKRAHPAVKKTTGKKSGPSKTRVKGKKRKRR